MHRSFVPLLAALALVVPTSALAAKPVTPPPGAQMGIVDKATTDLLNGNKGKSGGAGGAPYVLTNGDSGQWACYTGTVSNGDGYGNKTFANYHFCVDGVSQFYPGQEWGWGGASSCFAACTWKGYQSDYDFQWGHRTSAEYDVISVGVFGVGFHVTSTVAAGICVAPQGWYWGC